MPLSLFSAKIAVKDELFDEDLRQRYERFMGTELISHFSSAEDISPKRTRAVSQHSFSATSDEDGIWFTSDVYIILLF